jgi:uncharacterized protein
MPSYQEFRIMPRVVHFEIHADNPERAIRFYEGMFGWKFQKWNGPVEYWLITTGTPPERGINGGLIHRHGSGPLDGQPVNAYACTVEVPAIDEYIAKVGTHGGTLIVAKMPIPGVGWLAHAKDPEGNIFGIMQADAKAK